MNHHESNEQIALFQWAQLQTGKYPELDLMFHIPNGGKRKPVAGKILRAEGTKSGVPDICLPVPRGKYHGMYIEMKFGKNKTTGNQDWWLDALARQGYCTIVSYGWEPASKAILQYLNLKGETA